MNQEICERLVEKWRKRAAGADAIYADSKRDYIDKAKAVGLSQAYQIAALELSAAFQGLDLTKPKVNA